MRKLLTILFVLTALFTQAQGKNPDGNRFVYNTLTEAVNTAMMPGQKVQVKGQGIFMADILKPGEVADSIITIPKPGGMVLRRDMSQSIALNFESNFGGVADGVTDNYNAFQKLAAFLNLRGGHANVYFGSSIYKTPVYYINRVKIYPTTVDTLYIRDTSYSGNDSLGHGGNDSLLVITTTQILDTVSNTITNINYNKLKDVHFFGGGATISSKGDFVRKRSRKTGVFYFSNYNSVDPFVLSDCENITIENLHLNGNADKMTREAGVNEGDCYGIKLLSCINVQINDVSTKYFATDGLYIDASNTLHPEIGNKRINSSNIILNNFVSRCNSRQGITAGSSDHVTCNNCDLSYTGDSLYTYGGTAPQRAVDLEPIFGLDKINTYTSNWVFNNCRFVENVGGAISTSLNIVKDVFVNDCYVDNRKKNQHYLFIMGINNFQINHLTGFTGTGSIYPVWALGKGQKSSITNSVLTCNSPGIVISGVTPEYGCDINNNVLIGQHDSITNAYFPYINARVNFNYNTISIDSAYYIAGGTANKALVQFCNSAIGNTWITNMKTAGGKMFTVNYAGSSNVADRYLSDSFAIRPFTAPNWNFDVNPVFTTANSNAGKTIIMDNGLGTPVKITSGQGIPVTGKWNRQDISINRDPNAAGWWAYVCTVSGDAALGTANFQGIGAVSGASAPTTYKYGLIKDFNNGISAGDSLIYNGSTPRLISRTTNLRASAYSTGSTNDTGMVAFKSPLAFSLSLHGTIKGTIVNGGKVASFTVTFTPVSIGTFAQTSLNIAGDSVLLSTKVRLLKDGSNAYYLSFFDTTSVLTDKTTIAFDYVQLAGIGGTLYNAGTTWPASLLTSLTGYTLQNTLVNTAINTVAFGGTGNTSFTTNKLNYFDGSKMASSGITWDNTNGTATITATGGDALITSRTVGANQGKLQFGGTDGRTIGAYNNGIQDDITFNANNTAFAGNLKISQQHALTITSWTGSTPGFFRIGTNSLNNMEFITNLSTINMTLESSTGKTFFGGAIRPKLYTVATLPTGAQGDMATVTDALSPVNGATVVGGGTGTSGIVPVFHNGVNWVVNGGSGTGTYSDAQARAAISLTTTGTSGTATYNNSTGVLNIPVIPVSLWQRSGTTVRLINTGDNLTVDGRLKIGTMPTGTLSMKNVVYDPTDSTLKQVNITATSGIDQTYTGAFTSDGTAASSPSSLLYSWSSDGKFTTVKIRFRWGTASGSMNFLWFGLPADCPAPKIPTDVTSNQDIITNASLLLQPSFNASWTLGSYAAVLEKQSGASTGVAIRIVGSSFSYQGFLITLIYQNL